MLNNGWKTNLINGGIIFLLAAVASIATDVARSYIKPNRDNVHVVDTAGIINAKQEWFTKELSRTGITDQERKRVFEQTKTFAIDLERELNRVQAECRCTIYDKGAVIVGNYDEITDQVKRRLGL